MKRLLLATLSLLLLAPIANGQSQYILAQLTGSPINTTGWNLTGNAAVGNSPVGSGNSEILLTTVANSQSGAIFFSQPIDIVQCNKWTVEFEFRIFDGSGADGIAFCLLDVPPTGFVIGGGIGIPAASNGLKIAFDTYNNCGSSITNPSIEMRWGAGYAGGECDYSQPTLDNDGVTLNFIRSNDYNQARIEYDAGNIDVYLNNTLYLSGFYQINFDTYAGFTASTGGSNDLHSIRNVVISTDAAQPEAGPPSLTMCTGGSVQLGTAVNPAYEYQWSPATGLNNPNSANPTLTLTNTGTNPQSYWYKVGVNTIGAPCVLYDSVQVTVVPLPTGDIVSNGGFCLNQAGAIQFNGTASNNATYNWNFNGGEVVSGSGAGPYSVEFSLPITYVVNLSVTDAPCGAVQFTEQITMSSPPVALYTYQQTDNYEVDLFNQSENSSGVSWQIEGIGNSSQQQAQFDFPGPGSYNLTMIVTNACGTDTVEGVIYVMDVSSIDENSGISGISLYPNPATDVVTLNLTGYTKPFNYSITDMSGKTIAMQNKVQGPQTGINVAALASGLYLLMVETDEGRIVSKLVKK